MVEGNEGLQRKAAAVLTYYGTELRALPSSIAAELVRIVAGKVGVKEWKAVSAAIESFRERSLRRMQHWLNVLDPRTALDVVTLKQAMKDSPTALYLLNSGFNRFSWLLAVGASGQDRSLSSLRSYAESCGQWMAAHELAVVVGDRDADLALGIRLNPPREATRRISPVFVHFRWASELMCRTFAEEVASNPSKYAGLEMVTVRAVSDLFFWVEAYISEQEFLTGVRSTGRIPTPSPGAQALLDALAIPAGCYEKRPVTALVSSLDMESHPFVKFGGVVAPVAYREASYILELALFSLARRRLGQEKYRSDLFEEVVKRSLREVLPLDIELPSGEIFCPIPGTSDSGETDFIMKSSSMTFIGECKSMTAVPTPGSVINTFTDDVGKAAKQLTARMATVETGNPVTVRGLHWGTPRGKVFGIAVPLHAYGGAVWNHECLPESRADHPRLAVMPVHQLLLVARAMTSGDDLGAYIEFRQQLFAEHVEMCDELDILVAYLASAKVPDSGRPVLPAYFVDLRASVVREVPSSASTWQRLLRKNIRRADVSSAL